MKYKGLETSCESAIRWVKQNLNPHQQLVITLDGVKVVSEDHFIPSHLIDNLVGKKVKIIDDGKRFVFYYTFYEQVKLDHPNLPPMANYYTNTKDKICDVIDVRPHLDYRDVEILTLTDGKYTYLVDRQACEEIKRSIY